MGAQGRVVLPLAAPAEALSAGDVRAPLRGGPAAGGAAGSGESGLHAARGGVVEIGSFEEIYEEHFDFVWRSVRRLGVQEASVDDAVQDVFVVVHRRSAEFEGRSSLRTWIFGIVVHVARAYRRRRTLEPASDPDEVMAPIAHSPHARAEAAEAMRLLYDVLDTLDDERREVFVLVELSEMTAPEAAQALGLKINTVYSRLRAARHDFDAEVARRAARDGWRLP